MVQFVILVSNKIVEKEKKNYVVKVGGEAGWRRQTERRREGRVTTARKGRKPSTLFTDNLSPSTDSQLVARKFLQLISTAAEPGQQDTAQLYSAQPAGRPHPGVHQPSAGLSDLCWPE